MAAKTFTDSDIAIALRATGGSVIRAAQWLGCSVLTARNRIDRSAELQGLRVHGRPGRRRGGALRVVTDEQIIAALDLADSVKVAASVLGVARQTILSRAYEPTIEAALTRCEERHAASTKSRAAARLDARRAEISETMARAEERRSLLEEMRDSWQRSRDSWIASARERGLSLKEMAGILGLTRERVRQLEAELGMVERSRGRKRRAA